MHTDSTFWTGDQPCAPEQIETDDAVGVDVRMDRDCT